MSAGVWHGDGAGGEGRRRGAMEAGESLSASAGGQTKKEMWMWGDAISFSWRIARATGIEETVKRNSEGES